MLITCKLSALIICSYFYFNRTQFQQTSTGRVIRPPEKFDSADNKYISAKTSGKRLPKNECQPETSRGHSNHINTERHCNEYVNTYVYIMYILYQLNIICKFFLDF